MHVMIVVLYMLIYGKIIISINAICGRSFKYQATPVLLPGTTYWLHWPSSIHHWLSLGAHPISYGGIAWFMIYFVSLQLVILWSFWFKYCCAHVFKVHKLGFAHFTISTGTVTCANKIIPRKWVNWLHENTSRMVVDSSQNQAQPSLYILSVICMHSPLPLAQHQDCHEQFPF